jgi:glycosyltransferase involved in cell wall biosynthesis
MKKTAILIPCYNEEKTIEQVVEEFRAELPEAVIYVYDNNSEDDTAEKARMAGAIVRYEKRQGKGNVMRSMLRDIDADIYVMVDGDATYPANKVKDLIEPVDKGIADMVMGSRLHSSSKSTIKTINLWGNKVYLMLLSAIFRVKLTDLLTGYRAFNRRIANLPILTQGFDIEMELTLKTIQNNYKITEVPVNLVSRPEGSESKISIVKDGLIILNALFSIMRDYKPLTAFGALGLVIIIIGFIPGVDLIKEFLSSGSVTRIPLLIISLGTIFAGSLIIFAGLMLHTISRRFQELEQQVQNAIFKGSSQG